MSATSQSLPAARRSMIGRVAAPRSAAWARRLGAGVGCAVPGVLTLYLSFNSGGYFAGSQGVVLAALGAILAIRVLVARAPFAGFTRTSIVMLGALAAYALWTLASASWSHAPARGLLGFNLAALYLLAAFFSISINRSERRVSWTVGLTWAAMLLVCAASLATRLRPDLFPIPSDISANRLAFPLTYWNALGLFATIGLILTLNLASSGRGPAALRIFATATAPVFAVTMLLTYSRATMILGGCALVAYVVLARSPGLVGALIAAVPTSVAAVISTYNAKLISNAYTTPAAVVEGQHLVTVIALSCLAAAALRLTFISLDAGRYRVPWGPVARPSRHAVVLGTVVVVAALGLAFSARISSAFHTFLKSDTAAGTSDVRNRLGSIRIGSRLDNWRVAVHMFERNPVRGTGANTYALYWQHSSAGAALQTHSLYLQALSELGIPGLLAILTAVLVLVGGLWARRRRGSRSIWSAIVLVGVLWTVHAGLDWDWQMPALTLPVIALGAAGLSRRSHSPALPGWAQMPLRGLIALLAVGVAVLGLHVAASDARLSAAVVDFNRGDCAAAQSDAAGAIAAVSSRPQPYAIEGYCDVLVGRPVAAVAVLQEAVRRDPSDWRYHYGLAVSQAADGVSPMRELEAAATLSPSESDIATARTSLARKTGSRLRTAARLLPMPVSMRQ